MEKTAVEIGVRYPDDSGWMRYVRLDRSTDSVTIQIKGRSLDIEIDDAFWLYDALIEAIGIIPIPERNDRQSQ